MQITYNAPFGVTSVNLPDGSVVAVVNGQFKADSIYSNQLASAGCYPSALSFVGRFTASRNSASSDNGQPLGNSGTSNLTYTVLPGMGNSFGTSLQQESTGTVTAAAGAGVTFIGSTLSTTTQGQIIYIIPTTTPDTYIIKVG